MNFPCTIFDNELFDMLHKTRYFKINRETKYLGQDKSLGNSFSEVTNKIAD